MSYPDGIKARMAELLEQDAESWSRLSGMMAILALPSTRRPGGEYRSTPIEIEIAHETWAVVDCLAIESDQFVFWRTVNGRPIEPSFRFPRAGGAPRWRRAQD